MLPGICVIKIEKIVKELDIKTMFLWYFRINPAWPKNRL